MEDILKCCRGPKKPPRREELNYLKISHAYGCIEDTVLIEVLERTVVQKTLLHSRRRGEAPSNRRLVTRAELRLPALAHGAGEQVVLSSELDYGLVDVACHGKAHRDFLLLGGRLHVFGVDSVGWLSVVVGEWLRCDGGGEHIVYINANVLEPGNRGTEEPSNRSTILNIGMY